MGGIEVLAAQARRLKRAAGAEGTPSLFFLTDPERTPDPLAAVRDLPRGAAVIYRHFGGADRRRVARALGRLCRVRGLALLIAADPQLAAAAGAQGVHWPEAWLPAARLPEHGSLVTAAAHGVEGAARAARYGADAVLLSPIFPTRSSAGRPPLGLFRASQVARAAGRPVIALGGVNAGNARRLAGRGFAGIAAIDALMPRAPER
ncbi:MAG: thiamine phosphate synthase [Hyphomonadaceae bacterium]|nr:thiamine phosphate synthase [Hyphomonadaceae bacterium]MBX3510453.1 thiamine phosphate synthase [Hyphomonadaceae bacterium]